MTLRRPDPLLTVARAMSWFFTIMLSIAAVLVAVAIPMVAFNSSRVVAELAKEGITVGPEIAGGIALLLAGVFLIVVLAVWFLRLLLQIINTVGAGNPFILDNARRLERMAWISLSTFVISIPIGTVALWIGSRIGQGNVNWDFDLGGGLLVALVLFILARVFKQGAAMRDDLEGTV